MATVDVTNGTNYPYDGSGKVYVIENTLDFSVTSRTAADVLQVLNVNANTLVLECMVKVVTAEGGTATFDLGDGDDPNGYADAVDANSAGELVQASGAYALETLGGRLYTAADTIDITLDHTVDAAKVTVKAVVVDVS